MGFVASMADCAGGRGWSICVWEFEGILLCLVGSQACFQRPRIRRFGQHCCAGCYCAGVQPALIQLIESLVMLCVALLTVGAACCRSFTTSGSKMFTRVLEAVACDNPAGPFLIAVPLLLNVAWLLLGGFLGAQYGALPLTLLSTAAEVISCLAKVPSPYPRLPAAAVQTACHLSAVWRHALLPSVPTLVAEQSPGIRS